MTRYIIFGDTGDGKTLTAVSFIVEHYLSGEKWNIYSNIHLKGIDYIPIEDTAFIESLDARKNNFVFIDEVGEIGRGHYQFTFNSLVSQSRKSIGENQIFMMTTQTQNQANIVLKGMVDFFIYPNIILREGEDERPALIELDFYKKNKRSVPLSFSLCNDLIPKSQRFRFVYDICDYYDTLEMVEGMQDGRLYKYLELYENFIDSTREIKNLKTIINEKHGLSLSESERMARKVIFAKEWGFYDKWMDKKSKDGVT